MSVRAHQIDLNDASISVLEAVFHDRERANQILNARERSGDFKSWHDVQERVHGLDDAAIASLKEAGVTVGSEAQRTEGKLEQGAKPTRSHATARPRS